jgi:hypothetical protein
MPTPGTPLSAKNAVIRIGTTKFYGSEWTVTPETAWDDTTNFEGNGYENQVACTRKCTVTMTAFWDRGQNPHDSPPGFQDGQELVNVYLYTNGINSPAWIFPLFDVIGVPVAAKVKEKLAITINGKAQGQFSYPTGSF